jgi:tRNA uridine 5-carboxymethylaminomethyl modification enzyme
VNPFFNNIGSAPISEKQKLDKIILRPSVGLSALSKEVPQVAQLLEDYTQEAIEQSEIQTKYQVYIGKEKELVDKMRQLEDLEIPQSFDYQRIISLGVEAREKLNKIRPRTLGQASRISGINPSDVQILMVYMGR